MTFYYLILKKKCSYTREDTRLHTLISYVLSPPFTLGLIEVMLSLLAF